jgi:hypothetical protein
MFRPKKINFEDLARRLARNVIRRGDLVTARRDGVISDEEFKWLDVCADYIPPAWTSSTATPANVQRRAPAPLQFWKMIRSGRASKNNAPAPKGEGWFSAAK